MSEADDCRERADKCRARAESALTAEDRARWLGMAQFWLKHSQAKSGATRSRNISELVGKLCNQFASKS